MWSYFIRNYFQPLAGESIRYNLLPGGFVKEFKVPGKVPIAGHCQRKNGHLGMGHVTKSDEFSEKFQKFILQNLDL